MGAPIVHFEVMSKDLKRAMEFYGHLFGWKIQETPGYPYGLVDTGVKMGINGGVGQVDPEKAPFATFYVQVEDPQSYLDKAVSLGAAVLVPLTVVPDMVTYAMFKDPDGCIVGLLKGPQTPPKEKPKPRKPAAKKKSAKAIKGKGKKRGRK
jgi:predicted enzyme related to lactoylglutathione lyase